MKREFLKLARNVVLGASLLLGGCTNLENENQKLETERGEAIEEQKKTVQELRQKYGEEVAQAIDKGCEDQFRPEIHNLFPGKSTKNICDGFGPLSEKCKQGKELSLNKELLRVNKDRADCLRRNLIKE